jgi:tetratricopeptide (TPR) repeat protein
MTIATPVHPGVGAGGGTPRLGPGRLSEPRGLLRRLPVLVPTIGLLLGLLGLNFPWLGVALETERHAVDLRMVAAGMPDSRLISYGSLTAVALVVGATLLVRARGRATAALAVCGAVMMLLPLLFVLQSAVSDFQLVQHINQQNAEMRSITSQLGYSIPRSGPTSVLLYPIGGSTRAIAADLRPGWVMSLLGGLLILAFGLGTLVRGLGSDRRLRWGALATGVALGILLGRGGFANYIATSAEQASQAGEYSRATQLFDYAQRLNPLLRFNANFEFGLGRALGASGDSGSPLALYAQAKALGTQNDTVNQLADLQTAAEKAPENPVIVQELISQARKAALINQDRGLMQAIVSQPYGDLPAAHYALGRILYAGGDFDHAIGQLLRTIQLTNDPNVRSSAYTYISLSERSMGRLADARTHLLTAIALDTEFNNSLARSLAAGLYVSEPRKH